MCYADDASPPAPPVRGQVAEHGDLVLTSADGTAFGAYQARPADPGPAAMVVLPDVRGLHRFYSELACRFAEAGRPAVAVDYFGRTAGVPSGPEARAEQFPFKDHMAQIDWAKVAEDCGAAVDWVRANTAATAIFTVGFCFGGAMSWRQSAAGHGLAGCVGFYGVPSRVTDVVDGMRAPLLLLAAGQDFTPVDEVEKFAGQVRDAGVEAELHVYPDAPHSFFDRSFAEHADDCADAWRRMLAFIERHTG